MKDTSLYQVVRGGKTIQVNDLTVEELREELATAIDAIESIQEMYDRMSLLFRGWREGREYSVHG